MPHHDNVVGLLHSIAGHWELPQFNRQRLTVITSHTPKAAKMQFAAQAEIIGGSTPA